MISVEVTSLSGQTLHAVLLPAAHAAVSVSIGLGAGVSPAWLQGQSTACLGRAEAGSWHRWASKTTSTSVPRVLTIACLALFACGQGKR